MVLKDFKVFIDAGHGGADPGAVSLDGTKYEKEITLYVANKLNSILKAKGVTTALTRTTDVYVPYENVASLCNNSGAGIFVSLHCNSGGGAGGSETYTHSSYYTTYDTDLATRVNNAMVGVFKSPNRGVKRADYAVLRGNNAYCCLAELLFMDVSTDISKLRSYAYLDQAAQAIANALDSFVVANFKNTPA